jgi:hypothetical protein
MIFIKIEIEKMKKMENELIFNKKNEKSSKNRQKIIMQKNLIFFPKKRIVGVMVIKSHFFKKNTFLPCKKRIF